MKKIILILFIVGCSKDKEPICWICDINLATGGQPAPGRKEICNDSEHPPQQWTDGLGNVWGGFECTKK